MDQHVDERWRTVDLLERGGDAFLLQQKMAVTKSPPEEDRLDDSSGFSVLPEKEHRVVPLDAVVERDARDDASQ